MAKVVVLTYSSSPTGNWDLQPGETAKGFHAFTHYRDLPPHARSIDAAYAEHRHECEGREPTGRLRAKNWHKWSTIHDWVARVQAHDTDLSRRRREKRAADLEAAQDRAAILARAGLSRIALRFQNTGHLRDSCGRPRPLGEDADRRGATRPGPPGQGSGGAQRGDCDAGGHTGAIGGGGSRTRRPPPVGG